MLISESENSKLVPLDTAIKIFESSSLSNIGSLSPYYTYLETLEDSENAKPLFWNFSQENEILLYSFILKKLPDDICTKQFHYDIYGPYGYSCPVSNSSREQFLENAYIEFNKWVIKNKIFVEFLKFHPLIEPILRKTWCKKNGNSYLNRKTVSMDLEKKDILLNFRSRMRTYIRRLLRENHLKLYDSKTPSLDKISIFSEMYFSHMKLINANDEYFFSKSKIEGYLKSNDSRLFILYESGQACASGIFQEGKSKIVEYFLGCNIDPRGKNKLMLIMLYLIAEFYKNQNYKTLYLGGGRSTNENDSLLKFKMGIGNRYGDFWIGSNIYNQNYYDELGSLKKYIQNNKILFYRHN